MDLFKRIQDLSAIYDDDGPSAMVQERPMFNDGGMLVQPSDDGSRPGYSGKKHNLSTTTDRPEKYTKELLKKFREDMPPGLSIEEGRPGQFNYKIIIKGRNKNQPTIRMSGVVNENNKKLFTDFVTNKTKEYYPNRLTNEEFKKLRIENKSMKTEDFAKFLNDQGYESMYGKKWEMKNISRIQTSMNLGKGETGPLTIRTTSEAKKIILETPGGKIFLKSNPTDSEITRRASDLISQEKTRGKSGTYWPPGGTKETKMFHNFYQSSTKKDGRMKLLTKTPLDENGNINWRKIEKNGLPAWKNAKFFDNKSGATFKWGKNYKFGNLRKQVDTAYGNGFFAKSVKVYDEQAKLSKTTFGGKSLNEIIREGILKKDLVVKLGREPTPKELKDFYKQRLGIQISEQQARADIIEPGLPETPEMQSGSSGYTVTRSGQTISNFSQLPPHHTYQRSKDGRGALVQDFTLYKNNKFFGIPVPSPVSGKVSWAGPAGGGGNWVELMSDSGQKVELGHFDKIGVKAGQTVKAFSTSLGTQGFTGNIRPKNKDGTHVHMQAPDEVMKRYVNTLAKYQYGGLVRGPGGIDNVPAMLTAGEIIIDVDSAGPARNLLLAMNQASDKAGIIKAIRDYAPYDARAEQTIIVPEESEDVPQVLPSGGSSSTTLLPVLMGSSNPFEFLEYQG